LITVFYGPLGAPGYKAQYHKTAESAVLWYCALYPGA